MILPDVNVLVALAWRAHEHHRAARRWYAGVDGLATCSITQLGFLRVSSMIEYALDLSESRRVLMDMISFKKHEFWEDDLEPLTVPVVARGPKQLTDAHLASLAMNHRGILATFDSSIAGLLGIDPARLKVIRP